MSEPRTLAHLLEIQTHAQLGDPDCIVSADEMARRLRKLKDRHQPRKRMTFGGKEQVSCRGCHDPWPCPDAEILEGRE